MTPMTSAEQPYQQPEGWLMHAVANSRISELAGWWITIKECYLCASIPGVISTRLNDAMQRRAARLAGVGHEFDEYRGEVNMVCNIFDPIGAVHSPILGRTYAAANGFVDVFLLGFAGWNWKYHDTIASGRVFAENLERYQKTQFGELLMLMLAAGVGCSVLNIIYSSQECKALQKVEIDNEKLEEGLKHVEGAIKSGERLRSEAHRRFSTCAADTEKYHGFLGTIRRKREEAAAWKMVARVERNTPILQAFADDLRRGMGKPEIHGTRFMRPAYR